MLQLYSVWHLNLCYSSIEEAQRPEVVTRCYWPLLDLARARRIPVGIEATSWTLERIAEIDSTWLGELRTLIDAGLVEFIGSGYAQVIGPIVPGRVVRENLRLGNLGYRKFFGATPALAVINEQAWSAGLLGAYHDAAYRAVIMEWENPASVHPEWRREWRYYPQRVVGNDADLPLIWNHSFAFQKMQRLVHGEIPYEEWAEWVGGHDAGDEVRSLCIYGSDAETFGFRPGRYRTEEAIGAGEWTAIGDALDRLRDKGMRHVLPSRVLDEMHHRNAGQRLRLETADQPIPTKKQPKYNIVRWACGGRDAPGANTLCQRIYQGMIAPGAAPTDVDWATLCALWASDVRTHLTASRWVEWQKCAQATAEKWAPGLTRVAVPVAKSANASTYAWSRRGRFIEVRGEGIAVRLNLRRGMVIDELRFEALGDEWLLGTLHHGRFDDINWSADFYTWETVMELPGKPKVADLESVEPTIEEADGRLVLTGVIQTALGAIQKRIVVTGGEVPSIGLELTLLWSDIPPGSLRLGDLIVNPEAFNRNQLFVTTHLGGTKPETFDYSGQSVDHGRAWSSLISAQQCLGVTEGWLIFGDDKRQLRVEIDRTATAAPAMVTCVDLADEFVFRIQFSGREIDDTVGSHRIPVPAEGRTYHFTVSPIVAARNQSDMT